MWLHYLVGNNIGGLWLGGVTLIFVIILGGGRGGRGVCDSLTKTFLDLHIGY